MLSAILYGMTYSGGSALGGTVFKLTPTNGGYVFSTVYALGHEGEGCNPEDALVMDVAGNLYATAAQCGEYNWGAVFKLTLSHGSWTYTSLHEFEADDGEFPTSKPIFDASGKLYVTAQFGGTHDKGVILEITQ